MHSRGARLRGVARHGSGQRRRAQPRGHLRQLPRHRGPQRHHRSRRARRPAEGRYRGEDEGVPRRHAPGDGDAADRQGLQRPADRAARRLLLAEAAMRRRDFLKLGAAASLAGCASPGGVKPKARVLVIGAGFGGATAAKYVAMWEPGVQVVLVDRGREFISCPISNLVLGGNRSMRDITHSYDGLRKYGVDVLNGEAVAIDSAKKLVTFGRGSQLVYDRLVLSPGVDFLFSEVEGYEAAADRVLHAWKAGPQTVELRRQLEAMPDGGVYLLS